MKIEAMSGGGQVAGWGEKRPGTYALLLRSLASGRVAVGRHGALAVRRGWYVYVGSARGPGGLRGRLLHHLRPAGRPHWHIDYLRQQAAVREIWAATQELTNIAGPGCWPRPTGRWFRASAMAPPIAIAERTCSSSGGVRVRFSRARSLPAGRCS